MLLSALCLHLVQTTADKTLATFDQSLATMGLLAIQRQVQLPEKTTPSKVIFLSVCLLTYIFFMVYAAALTSTLISK